MGTNRILGGRGLNLEESLGSPEGLRGNPDSPRGWGSPPGHLSAPALLAFRPVRRGAAPLNHSPPQGSQRPRPPPPCWEGSRPHRVAKGGAMASVAAALKGAAPLIRQEH